VHVLVLLKSVGKLSSRRRPARIYSYQSRTASHVQVEGGHDQRLVLGEIAEVAAVHAGRVLVQRAWYNFVVFFPGGMHRAAFGVAAGIRTLGERRKAEL
jgi:hypothetical protein